MVGANGDGAVYEHPYRWSRRWCDEPPVGTEVMPTCPARPRCSKPPTTASGRVAALTITDREAILRVLEDCPDGLAELRGVLLEEHARRVRERLV
jgi:hypothetical protein